MGNIVPRVATPFTKEAIGLGKVANRPPQTFIGLDETYFGSAVFLAPGTELTAVLPSTGVYQGAGIGGMPDPGNWHILVQSNSTANYSTVLAVAFGVGNTVPAGTTYRKTFSDGVQAVWERVATATDLADKANRKLTNILPLSESQFTGNLNDLALLGGQSAVWATNACANLPPLPAGNDGVCETRAYSTDQTGGAAFTYQVFSDWRTGGRYVRRQSTGAWAPWIRLDSALALNIDGKGGASPLAVGTNLDNFLATGFYFGSGLVNAPNDNYFHLQVQTDSVDFHTTRQVAAGATDGAARLGLTWQRFRFLGVWTAWEKVPDVPALNAKMDADMVNSTPLSDLTLNNARNFTMTPGVRHYFLTADAANRPPATPDTDGPLTVLNYNAAAGYSFLTFHDWRTGAIWTQGRVNNSYNPWRKLVSADANNDVELGILTLRRPDGVPGELAISSGRGTARFRERNYVGTLGITTNISVGDVKDDSTLPAWRSLMGGELDAFQVARSPANQGTPFETLISTSATGLLQVLKDDVEITSIGKGVIMKSPNGTRWRLTVSDAGALVTTQV